MFEMAISAAGIVFDPSRLMFVALGVVIGLSLGVLTAGHQAVVVGAVPFPVARATILVIELPIG